MAQNIVKYVLDLETKAAKKGLKGLGVESEKFAGKSRKAFGQIGAGLSGLKAGFDMVAGSMSAVISTIETLVSKSFELTQQAVDNINALNDLSNQSAVSAKTLQAVQLAFESSGQSAQAADQAMQNLPRRFSQIRTEGTKANELMKDLGFDPSFMNNEEMLKSIIKVLQQTTDKTARAEFAVSLLGRSGTKMLQAFSDTSDFENFVSITDNFGVNAKKGANSAAAFQKALATLKTVARGALDTIAQSTGAIDFFRDALRNGVFAVVFAAKSIQFFQGELKNLGQVMLVLIQKIMIPLFKGLAGISPQMSIAFNAMTATIKKGMDVFGKPVALVKFGTKIEMAKNEALKAVESLDLLNSTAAKNSATMSNLTSALARQSAKQEKAKKTTDSLSNARKKAAETLKELISDFNSQNITVDQANKSVSKLSKTFAKLKMPTSDLNAFQAQLDKIAGQNFIAEIEKQLSDGMKDFEALDIDIAVKGIKQGLKIAAVDFGVNLAQAISGSGQAIQALVSGIGGSLAGSIAGAMGSLSSIGQQLKQVGVDAVKAKEEELERPLTAKEQQQIIREAQMKDARDRVQNFIEGIIIALEVLPEILINVLPGAIVRGTFKLLQALFRMPANIIRGIRQIMHNVRDSIIRVLSGGFAFIKDALIELVTLGLAYTPTFDGKRSGGRFIPSARSGMRFTGPQKSGLALLHENEFVVPASGQKPQSVTRTMNQGGGITVNVSGMVVESNAVDQIVREIERRFQTFGTSKSSLFG